MSVQESLSKFARLNIRNNSVATHNFIRSEIDESHYKSPSAPSYEDVMARNLDKLLSNPYKQTKKSVISMKKANLNSTEERFLPSESTSHQSFYNVSPETSSEELPLNLSNLRFYHEEHSQTETDMEFENSTIRITKNFNPIKDASKLRATLISQKVNKESLIKILCHRSLNQRLIIAKKYKNFLGAQSLVKDIESRIKFKHGPLRKLLISLITPSDCLNVKNLQRALIDGDHAVVADILCTKTNKEIKSLKICYKKVYGYTLEEYIKTKTRTNFQILNLMLCKGRRDETGIINISAANKDAKTLHNLNKNDMSTLKNTFLKIFTTRSFKQIKLISIEYETLFHVPIQKLIKKRYPSCDREGYIAIAKFSRNKVKYYSKLLKDSFSLIKRNDEQLIRIIVTRSEIDLKDIISMYNKTNAKKTFQKKIEGSIEHNYYLKRALLALIESC